MTRFDELAWKSVMYRRATMPDHYGLAKSGRPANFAELEQVLRAGEDFTIAWCEFLDEFYLFKSPNFFTPEPSSYFDPKIRAWFAGVVEYLCRLFTLPVPAWTEEPSLFLQKYWRKSHDDVRDPAFARRNVGYNPRHLIRL